MRNAVARTRSPARIEVCGIGPAAALAAAERALAGPAMHGAVVVGLCGLLAPELNVGDVLVYGSIVSSNGDRRGLEAASPTDGLDPTSATLDPALASLVCEALPGARGGIRAVESPALVATAEAKRALAQSSAAQAVDMESLTLVARLATAGVPAAVVRVGSDRCDDDLPDLGAAVDARGDLVPWRVAMAMLRRPGAGVRLARNGMRALRALEASVEQLCAYASAADGRKP